MLLAAGTLALSAGFVAMVVLDGRHGTLRESVVPQTIVWYLVAFVGFTMAVVGNERWRAPTRWLWAGAIVFRLLLLATSPTLSDDVYRYLWDGHLVAEGVNPYAFAIDDPAGDPYEIPARALANNRTLSSPYLPTVHAVFGAAALVLPSEPIVLQAILVMFDLATAFLLARLLALAGLPARRLMLYLWNPLVIVEIAHSAHLDALMIMLSMAALVLTYREPSAGPRGLASTIGAPIALALATLTRFLPVLFLPVLFWRWSWLQRIVYVATCAIVVVPFGRSAGFGLIGETTGTGVFGSARAYSDTFRFNSGLYHWTERWISSQGLDSEGWNEPVQLTKLVIVAIFAVAMIAVWLRARHVTGTRAALRLMAAPFGIYIVLAPVMHPWYLLSFLVLLIFVMPAADESPVRWTFGVPWLYLAAASTLSYLTYEDPTAFAERGWVRSLEWMPTFALLTVAFVVGARTADQPPTLTEEPR